MGRRLCSVHTYSYSVFMAKLRELPVSVEFDYEDMVLVEDSISKSGLIQMPDGVESGSVESGIGSKRHVVGRRQDRFCRWDKGER